MLEVTVLPIVPQPLAKGSWLKLARNSTRLGCGGSTTTLREGLIFNTNIIWLGTITYNTHCSEIWFLLFLTLNSIPKFNNEFAKKNRQAFQSNKKWFFNLSSTKFCASRLHLTVNLSVCSRSSDFHLASSVEYLTYCLQIAFHNLKGKVLIVVNEN